MWDIYPWKNSHGKISVLVLHFLKRLYLGYFRSDLAKICRRHCGMMDVKRFLFHLVDRPLQWCLKSHVQLYQIGKSWFCVQVCGKIEDNTLLVILLINYQLKSLVCFVLSRFCNLKFTSKYNSLNKQNLSSLKITIIYLFMKALF